LHSSRDVGPDFYGVFQRHKRYQDRTGVV